MSRLKINYLEIEKIRQSRLCGYGLEGICYFLDHKTIIKLYKCLLASRKVYFEGLKSDYIAFPIDIYEYETTGLIQGYSSRYLKGDSLVSGFSPTLLIDTLLKAYNKARNEIKKYPDILMKGMNASNIILDSKTDSIGLIDTSLWIEQSHSTDENLKLFDFIMIMCLALLTLNMEDMVVKNNTIGKLYRRGINMVDTLDNEVFLEFLSELKERQETKVKTLADLEVNS